MDDLEDLRQRRKVTPKPLFDGRTVLLLSWITILAVGLGGWCWYLEQNSSKGDQGLSRSVLRDTANRLRGAGVKTPAAQMLGSYLQRETMPAADRVQLAMAAANLYLEEGNYEQALAFLYMADESNPPGAVKGDIAQKIVTSLEGLKKLGAARYALKTTSALDGADQIKRGGKIFAQVGDSAISVAEIEQALDDLPPQMAAQISTPEQKMIFAKSYVAEQLLARKAERQKLDEDPSVRRQIVATTRQLMVQKLLQKELESRGTVEEDDVKNYYEANKGRFVDKEGNQQEYAAVREQAAQAYMGEKLQKVYMQLLEEALAVEQAQFFPENLTGGAQ